MYIYNMDQMIKCLSVVYVLLILLKIVKDRNDRRTTTNNPSREP